MRFWKWVPGIAGFFILLIIVLPYVIHIDALRRYAERQMNRHLTDYTVRVGRAYFHPISLSLDLEDLVLLQNEIPDPPVASIKRLHASVHWTALIKGRLVGDFLIERPELYINLKQVRKEKGSKTTLGQKGWQDALEAVYPLKIDVFRIRNGWLTYVDQGPYKPLHAGGIFLHATNIRNIFSPETIYPSPVKIEATLFEKGKLTLDGHANFLQKTRVGFKGEVDLRDLDLGYFAPITERQNLTVRKGTLSAKGSMEFAPKNTEVHLKAIELKGFDADYGHRAETAAKEQEQVQKATKAAEMTIRNNRVQGYVKPIFKNMEVTDMRTPEQKSLSHKLYVGAVSVMTKLLKNRPRQQVATETDISGPLENPSTNTGQIIVNLVRNAFFKAILPGFEREVSHGQQKK